MTCTAMIAFKLQGHKKHMPISKMPKHGILNRCGSQTPLKRMMIFFFFPFFLWFWPPRAHITQKSQIYRLILHIKSEKYRSDLALTLSLLYIYMVVYCSFYILNTGLPICMVVIYA